MQADEAFDAAVDESSRVGQAMHRLLEWHHPGQSAFSTAQLAAVAQQFALPAAQCQRAGVMAMAIVQGQGAWVWDEAVIDWAANEVNFNWRGASLRLDRLVHRLDTGQWWVLDFKSAAQPLELAAMSEQLHSYRCAVQDAHPGENVRAAFLTAVGELKELN
jgi:ATP-dependent helicase/nuclease subunit A